MALVLSILVILLILRIVSYVVLRAFARAGRIQNLHNLVDWCALVGGALWVTGLLTAIWSELDDLTWKMGSSTVSMAMLLQGLVTAMVVMLFMLWISNTIERRLVRGNPTGPDLSLRKALSNALTAILLFIGVLLAFSSVGIDLTALSVLGGGMGVGIGLGLQRLAANYVSGFVILTERSMRIGDVIKVGSMEGSITQINTRYTVIRSSNGRENIIPNETLVTTAIENITLTDPFVSLSTTVTVPYGTDPVLVRKLLEDIAKKHPLVSQTPSAPSASLTTLGDSGMQFTLSYWFRSGQGNSDPKSDLNFDIVSVFKENRIEFAYPQRVTHVLPINEEGLL
jgi:small-conductance mechanosensitive channel